MSRHNAYNMPGYGDSETWPAYWGNPNDPRAPEPSDYDDESYAAEQYEPDDDYDE